ncbi:hypothetical protein AKO1_015809 [Acrasis kona]|uniref:LisH domain-containing protein n=1 Tax=Acrasis kona TaxID=1008807 RepID=A0AAW2ZJ88_9EUKA
MSQVPPVVLSIDEIFKDEKFESSIKGLFYHYLLKKGLSNSLHTFEAESKLYFSKEHFLDLIKASSYDKARSYIQNFIPQSDDAVFVLYKLEFIHSLVKKEKTTAFTILNDFIVPITKPKKKAKKFSDSWQIFFPLMTFGLMNTCPLLAAGKNTCYLSNHDELKEIIKAPATPNLKYIVQKFGETVAPPSAAGVQNVQMDADDEDDNDEDGDLMNWLKPAALGGKRHRSLGTDNADSKLEDPAPKRPKTSTPTPTAHKTTNGSATTTVPPPAQAPPAAAPPAQAPPVPQPQQPTPQKTTQPPVTQQPTTQQQPTPQKSAPPQQQSVPTPKPVTSQPVTVKQPPVEKKPEAPAPAAPITPSTQSAGQSTPQRMNVAPIHADLPVSMVYQGTTNQNEAITRLNYSHGAGLITFITSANELKCHQWFDPRSTTDSKIDSNPPQEIMVEVETPMPSNNNNHYRAFCVINKNDSFFLLGGGSNLVRILTLKLTSKNPRPKSTSASALQGNSLTSNKILREISKINIPHAKENQQTSISEVTAAAFCPEDNNYYILGYKDGYVMVTKYGSNSGEECAFNVVQSPVQQLAVSPTNSAVQGTTSLLIAVMYANGSISVIELLDYSDKPTQPSSTGKRFVGKIIDTSAYNNGPLVKANIINSQVPNVIEIRPNENNHLAIKLSHYVILYDIAAKTVDKYSVTGATAMCFSHDGRSVLIATLDNTIHCVPINVGHYTFVNDPTKVRVTRLTKANASGGPSQDYPSCINRNPKVVNQYCIGMSKGGYSIVMIQ